MTREFVVAGGTCAFRGTLQLAGSFCQVNANSDIVVHGLRTWLVRDRLVESASFSLQIFVTPGARSDCPPHFRGRKHLVIASFGVDNVFTFDLARRNVTAVITPDVAADQDFWNRVLLPIAMGVLGPAFGVVPVHSACLVAGSTGILIAGESGAGKSTLSIALAQAGFGFVSDDWTYLSLSCGQLVASGLAVPAKLLPDAVNHFPQLNKFRPGIALNQELAYELPSQELGAEVQLSCEPRWFFFLERTGSVGGCEVLPIASEESQHYVNRTVERLPPELEDVLRSRSAVLAHMPRLSCWKLRYGGPPTVAVHGLQEFLMSQRQCVSA